MAASLDADELVVRYVGGSNFDERTGKVDGSAFDRKPKDDDGLSFTRRYFLNKEDDEDKNAIREIFASRMKVGSTAQFAQLRVGDALEALSEFGDIFDFVEDELAADGDRLANPAHSLLMGLPFVDEVIGSLRSEVAGDLLARCITSNFRAKLEDEDR